MPTCASRCGASSGTTPVAIREQVAFLRDDGRIVRHDFVVMVRFGANGVRGERTYASPELNRLFLGEFYDELEPIARDNDT